MKKIATLLNPILIQIKYLLLTVLLIIFLVTMGRLILKNIGIDISITMNIERALIPFFMTAIVSMFIIRKFENKKH